MDERFHRHRSTKFDRPAVWPARRDEERGIKRKKRGGSFLRLFVRGESEREYRSTFSEKIENKDKSEGEREREISTVGTLWAKDSREDIFYSSHNRIEISVIPVFVLTNFANLFTQGIGKRIELH